VRVATIPQTVSSLFSRNDNHHHSTHRIANTLLVSYHLHSRSLLTTLTLRQPPSGACTAAILSAHHQTSITFTLSTFARGRLFDQPSAITNPSREWFSISSKPSITYIPSSDSGLPILFFSLSLPFSAL